MNEGKRGIGQHPSQQQKGFCTALIIFDGEANSLIMMMPFILDNKWQKQSLDNLGVARVRQQQQQKTKSERVY